MFIGGGRAVGRAGQSLSRAILVCLSVLLAASSCTEPYDSSGQQHDASTIDKGDGASLDLGAGDRTDGRVDGDGATDGPRSLLSLDITTHDFDRVVINTASAGATFTIKNNGTVLSDPLSVMINAAGASAGFSLMSDNDGCEGTRLPPGGTCQVVVSFTPTTVDKQMGLLIFRATGFDAVATLLGEGITPGTLSIDPTTQSFGLVVINKISIDQTFKVTNTGEDKTGMITTALAGTDAANFEITADGCKGTILTPMQSCQITARFVPTSLGDKSASLQVSGYWGQRRRSAHGLVHQAQRGGSDARHV